MSREYVLQTHFSEPYLPPTNMKYLPDLLIDSPFTSEITKTTKTSVTSQRLTRRPLGSGNGPALLDFAIERPGGLLYSSTEQVSTVLACAIKGFPEC